MRRTTTPRASVVKHRVTEHCEPGCHDVDRLWVVWLDYGNGPWMFNLCRTHENALRLAIDVAR